MERTRRLEDEDRDRRRFLFDDDDKNPDKEIHRRVCKGGFKHGVPQNVNKAPIRSVIVSAKPTSLNKKNIAAEQQKKIELTESIVSEKTIPKAPIIKDEEESPRDVLSARFAEKFEEHPKELDKGENFKTTPENLSDEGDGEDEDFDLDIAEMLRKRKEAIARRQREKAEQQAQPPKVSQHEAAYSENDFSFSKIDSGFDLNEYPKQTASLEQADEDNVEDEKNNAEEEKFVDDKSNLLQRIRLRQRELEKNRQKRAIAFGVPPEIYPALVKEGLLDGQITEKSVVAALKSYYVAQFLEMVANGVLTAEDIKSLSKELEDIRNGNSSYMDMEDLKGSELPDIQRMMMRIINFKKGR